MARTHLQIPMAAMDEVVLEWQGAVSLDRLIAIGAKPL